MAKKECLKQNLAQAMGIVCKMDGEVKALENISIKSASLNRMEDRYLSLKSLSRQNIIGTSQGDDCLVLFAKNRKGIAVNLLGNR